jgi:D-amino-acid dehydrogenase
MSYQKSDVLIIGAGVIGLSCAYELSKSGVNVTVIDKSEPGFGCSYGNAGWITPCFAMPLPMPGMFIKSLKWLIDPMSPLHINPHPSVLLVKWLIRFLQSMNSKTANRSIAALTEISKYSLKEYEKLESEIGISFGFDRKGLLMVGQTKESVQAATQEMNLVAEHGIPGKLLKESEIKALEPALTGPLQGGVYFPEEAHAEPLAVVRALAKGAIHNGVKIISSAEVFEFQVTGKQIQSVRTTRGTFEANQFVLSTGSWSQALIDPLKLNLPILGGKGYSLILPKFQPAPTIPIMIVDKKIAITPRKDSVRIAGTLELVNQDFSIKTRRVDAIIRGSQECLNVPVNPELIELWRGLRPCTPDGVPIIGFSKPYANLFISAGHQMLGLQSAPGTGRLASDLILGRAPVFDPLPFRATRF